LLHKAKHFVLSLLFLSSGLTPDYSSPPFRNFNGGKSVDIQAMTLEPAVCEICRCCCWYESVGHTKGFQGEQARGECAVEATGTGKPRHKLLAV
jgi:hypothetical protein